MLLGIEKFELSKLRGFLSLTEGQHHLREEGEK